MKNEYDIKRFLDNVEDAGKCFNVEEEPNGLKYLSTTVHNDYTVNTYELTVIPAGFLLVITTETPLTVNPSCTSYLSMNNLFESINKIVRTGNFIISKDNHIEFVLSCTTEQFYSCENPYHILFYGIETINAYVNDIMGIYSGKRIFYLKL